MSTVSEQHMLWQRKLQRHLLYKVSFKFLALDGAVVHHRTI